MTAKLFFVLLLISTSLFKINTLVPLDQSMINLEAKYYCQCHKQYAKKIKRAERKEKRLSKNTQYDPTARLFGGSAINFSFKNCMEQKRNRRVKVYIQSLDDDTQVAFRKKVTKAIRKKGLKQSAIFY